ncbi:hypothetical protein OBBRIDRAFT_796326 [Obba rivulosa]|uniref:Uncharacterized protein n=1 Tax=Obba rivulosa TaxID=1052685 RepID=A0A8E2ASQ2_9APHY|nr:hypothetical protein OBBRIDRAFT_796326 [Obba rivulosa]
MASPSPSTSEFSRRGRHSVRGSISVFYTLTPPTPDRLDESSRLSRQGTASLLSRSSPASTSPGTPSMPHVRECTTYNYDGVPYTSPKRPRAVSMHPPVRSPALLPIGRGAAKQHARSASTAGATAARFGLGLTLDQLATAPSLQPEAAPTREERARRRHAIDFHTHMHYSEVLHLNTERDADVFRELERGTRSKDTGARSRERSGSQPEEMGSPGGVSVGNDGDGDGDGDAGDMDQELGIKDITSAFPSPPLSPPGFSPSLISRMSLAHAHLPPPIPLPPTPAIQPSCFHAEEYDSPSSGETAFDPSESMVMLERSIAKLEEAFNPRHSAWSDISASDNDAISVYSGSSEASSTGESSNHNSSPATTEQYPHDDSPQVGGSPQLDPEQPREGRSDQAILTMLSVLSVSEASLPIIRLSHASTVSKLASPEGTKDAGDAEEHRHRSSALFLPKFDFEQRKEAGLKVEDLPPRSASLTDIPSHLHPLSAFTPPRGLSGVGHTRGSSDASKRHVTDKRPSTSSGVPTREGTIRSPFHSNTPLRHPKTPFLLRPLRHIEPSSDQSSCSPPRTRAESHTSGLPPILTPPTSSSRQTDGNAQSTFVSLTSEQHQSKMSKIWTRARTGVAAGLRKEKSNRWLRGSFMQTKGCP